MESNFDCLIIPNINHIKLLVKDKQMFIEKEMRNYLAAYKIQQWWYKITLSPEYKIGREFINRKYDKCFYTFNQKVY